LAHARDFLMPVVLAFLLALVFSPVRRFLDRRRVPSWLSALVIVGALFAVIVAGILALSGPVADWINRAPSIFADLQIKMRGIAATMAEVTDKVDSIAKSPAAPEVPEVVVKQPGITASLAGLAPVFIAQIGFVLVLLLFLLSSGDMIYEKIVHVMPTLTDKKRAVRIARDIEQKLSTYLFTITVINTGLGIAVGVTMWAIGMPNPLLFGVAAFAFNYIPYVGAVTGVVLATIVGLISGDELWLGAVAGGSYLLLTTIEGQLITPYFVGRRLRLNTVVVFLSIALWAWLWSVVGMIVATPLLVAVRTFCEYIPSLENVGAFLSARGDEQEDTDAPSPT
jgi:predicted PurR-regulated permease PerM